MLFILQGKSLEGTINDFGGHHSITTIQLSLTQFAFKSNNVQGPPNNCILATSESLGKKSSYDKIQIHVYFLFFDIASNIGKLNKNTVSSIGTLLKID
jgi:hypothetical protein